MSKEIFVRIGFSDMVVPIKDSEKAVTQDQTYIIGYEFEDGTECDEDGKELS